MTEGAGAHGETAMPGGRTLGAVRVDDTVRRAWRPWTPSVQAVLRHLEAIGFAGAPRVLGVDDQGREVLSYLDGDTVGDRQPWPEWAVADAIVAEVGGWLRRLHDATRDFVPPAHAVWFGSQSWTRGLVIGHHDAAPYNAVWRSGEGLVGFVDWDTAGPSSRELDLAFSVLAWAPLQLALGDAPLTDALADRRRRTHLLLDGYGYPVDRSRFGVAVAGRARVNAAGIRRLAAGGDPVYLALLPVAAGLERTALEVESLPAAFWQRPAERLAGPARPT